jgi:transposase-like protein
MNGLSLSQFMERFNDDNACADHLFNLRWPGGFLCPQCGHDDYYFVQKRALYQCRACKHQASLTAGTIFHRHHVGLKKWFLAIYLISTDKRGYSALGLHRHLGGSYNTSWLMLHKIRAAMAHRDHTYKLFGYIQLDEAFFGGPNGKQGRGTEKSKVYVAVSADEKGRPLYAKMQKVDKLNHLTALEFAQSCISKGCTITSDKLNIYSELNKKGFTHIPVKSSTAEADEMLKWVHILISNAKAAIIGTFHGLGEKHLQSYLDAFCYRFGRRTATSIFGNLLAACLKGPYVPLKVLVAANGGAAELTE